MEKATPFWRWHTLAFSAKVQILKRKTWQVAWVGWGYLPLGPLRARAELGCLADFLLGKRGVLTLNGSGQAEPGRPPSYFATAFYTHEIKPHVYTWVEAFAYGPASTLGLGSGLQYLVGKERLGAVDVAFNYRSGGALQVLVGLSKKGQLFRRKGHA